MASLFMADALGDPLSGERPFDGARWVDRDVDVAPAAREVAAPAH
jgi:hypothetical protein